MMRSLFTGVSGLKNHQVVMDVIGNNIANVNTVGFKTGRANFQDILSQTVASGTAASGAKGGVNPMQVGLGAAVASIDTIFTTGSLQSTGKNSDLAIVGTGFFMVTDDPTNVNKYYTRAGNFDFDSQGNVVMSSTGMKVMGWQAVNGQIDRKANPEAIKIDMGQIMKGEQTRTANYSGNLSSANTVGSTAQGALAVYDAEGNTRRLTTMFTKTTDNSWLYSVAPENGQVVNPNNLGVITFNSDGTFKDVKTLKPGVSALATNNGTATQTTFTNNVVFSSLQLDAALNSVNTTYFTVYDNNGTAAGVGSAAHNFEMKIINKGTNSWSYEVKEVGKPAATATQMGTIAFDDTTKKYVFTTPDGAASSNLFKYTPDNLGVEQTVTFNIANMTHLNPAENSFVSKTIAPLGKTENVYFSAIQLDSTLGSVREKYFTIIDNNGLPKTVKMEFKNTSQGASWDYTCKAADPNDTTVYANGSMSYNAVAGNYVGLPSMLKFDSEYSVNLQWDNGGGGLQQTAPALGAFSVSETPVYQASASGDSVLYSPSSKKDLMKMTYDFSHMTQYGNPDNIAVEGDGFASGTLSKLTIDSSGIIIGSFSNNRTQTLAQIGLANFKNPGGLDKSGDSLYTESANSGGPMIGYVGQAGFGSITPGALEMSNVDLAQEFSNMITVQRGFQANSKIISVADEMLQTLANLKR